MQEKIITEELYTVLSKIIFPAFIAVGVKLAIELKRNKMKISAFNVITSMTIGVGSAYISSDYIISNCDKNNISIIIAIIAITADKIGEFLIYKLNVEDFLKNLLDSLIFNVRK